MNIDISKVDTSSILKDYFEAKTHRSGWEAKWNLIHDNVFPHHDDYHSDTHRSSFGGPADRQMKTKSGLMGPNTSSVCGMIHKIVSQLYALLVDPSTEWLGLESDMELVLPTGQALPFGQLEEVKDWVTKIKKTLLKLLRDPVSDFYTSSYQHIFNLFTLGTACREITLTREGKVKCNSVSMQSVYIGASGYGDVNRVYRVFNVTNQEAFDIWGEGVLKEGQYLPFEDKSKHTYIEFSGNTPQGLTEDKLPIAPYMSLVIRESDRKVVSYSFHKTFPYIVSRFDVMSGEIYGKTFVWDALPDIMTINKLSKLALENADWVINPPLLVKDATSVVFKQLGPKAIVQGLDSQNRPSIMPLQGMGGDVRFLLEYYQIKMNELAEGLVANDPLTPEMPNMTATEVTQRKIQSANRIRPMLVRFESEDLNPTIKRLMGLYSQLGKLPQFPYEKLSEYASEFMGMEVTPEILQQLLPDPIGQINIHFSGQMAKMQKMQEIQDVHAIIQAGIQLAQADPEVLDLVNLGGMYRFMIDQYGVTEGINDAETVKAIRKQKAEAQQSQQLLQASEASLQQAQREKILAEAQEIRGRI